MITPSVDLHRVAQAAGLLRTLSEYERAMAIQMVYPSRTQPLKRGRVRVLIVVPAVDGSSFEAAAPPAEPPPVPPIGRRRAAKADRWGVLDDPAD